MRCPVRRRHSFAPILVAAAGGLLMTLAAGHAADGRSLLASGAPGAFGVRYLPDRAVMTYTVHAPEGALEDGRFHLKVYLPQQPRWLYLDREAIDLGVAEWVAGESLVALDLPFGSHRLQLGWEGSGQLPPETALIPILINGEQKGSLRARFSLQGMEATGKLPVEAGSARLALRLDGEFPADEVVVTCGTQALRNWELREGGLASAELLLLPPDASLSLTVNHYALDAAPVAAVMLEDHREPSPVTKVDEAIPDGAVLVEAENWADAGGTPVTVDPGSHHDEHGGACVYSFHGDGAWLEWELGVPADGAYDLFARVSCGSERSFRAIAVDGASPSGLDLVEFPGTGGWGHAEGEWWLVRITGADDGARSLQLSTGKHKVRFTGVLGLHLNVDYLFLTPAP